MAEMEWQPIETAPRDGTAVLLYNECWDMSWGIQLGIFYDDRWCCGEGEVAEDDEYPPEYWMPLPEPPPQPPEKPTNAP